MVSDQPLKRFSKIVGSKSFLEPRILLIYVLPFSIINSVYAGRPDGFFEVWLWVLGNIIAIGLIAALIAAFRFSWKKLDYPHIPLLLIAVVSGFLGVSKSFLTLASVNVLSMGEARTPDLAVNLIGAFVLATPGLIFASAWGYLLREYTREREILITARGLEQMRKGSAVLKGKLAGLASELRKIAKELSTNPAGLIPDMEMGLIRTLVDSQVRPLATSVLIQLDKAHQSFALRKLLQTATRSAPPALLISLPLLFNTSQVISDYGVITGLLGVLAATTLSFVFTFVLGKIFELINLQGVISFYLSVIAGPTAGVFLAFFLTGNQIQQPGLTFLFLVFNSLFIGTVIGITKTAIISARENRQAVLDITESRGQSEYALLSKQRRALANQIHGEVQSRLMNMVLQSEAGSKITKAHAIEELNKVADLLEDNKVSEQSFDESIRRLIKTWRGFTTINVELNESDIPEAIQPVVFSIVEEGVTNAFKHGIASKVDVYLENHELVISDDGIGPTSGKPGLGSRLLSSLNNSWKLSAKADGGSELRVMIPN